MFLLEPGGIAYTLQAASKPSLRAGVNCRKTVVVLVRASAKPHRHTSERKMKFDRIRRSRYKEAGLIQYDTLE
ncbi:hypothetical protein KSX_27570 [Ktedonospora formicarum]|uniref:Uncharacterized protein n=1 Tax=Ktedonospora formicarum TaxID=2778364 RepID=A0A8J3HVM0_9CHLR|nr:hypothetical protein KSX_27570 [Ktedonospora formicarum]